MNGNTDFDRIAQAWLQDGPTEMPDRSLQAALDEVHVTSQQRFGAARRTFNMNGNAFRLAGAAAVALFIIVAGGIYLGNNSRSGGVGGPPATTAAPTATPSATPPVLPADSSLQPGRYRLGSLGVVAGSAPATLSVTVPSGWTSVLSNLVSKDYGADAGAAFGVWQINDRFNQPCTDHTLFTPVPGPGTAELLDTLASQPGITAGPVSGCDGRWIQRQIRRADRRHRYRHLRRRRGGITSVWLLAVGLARRRSQVRTRFRRDRPDLRHRRRWQANDLLRPDPEADDGRRPRRAPGDHRLDHRRTVQ